ncbi:MAG: AAA family ATPase [Cyclobacteriaceae bacterium]
MRVVEINIRNFRGIKESKILLPRHAVLVGDNNTGKSTVFEAIDLVLGPERLNRRPVINEHDFYKGQYISKDEDLESADIQIHIIVSDLSLEQRDHFGDYADWWDFESSRLIQSSELDQVDGDKTQQALQVTFKGKYVAEDDDFEGETFFTKSLENENPQKFRKADKHKCGFLYLRTVRTGSRALSLDKGSLLDIILRLKEVRLQMWEKAISDISAISVASDEELGISKILTSIAESIKKYVPKEWGVDPHLRVSNLTREHLRKIITAFIATGEGEHSAPFFRQGTGTVNVLVLAMLSQIAEDRPNVIFAMEEPETAIPPYSQKRIVHEIKRLSTQSLFTSHSPYVLEEFELSEAVVLSRNNDGELKQFHIELPKNLKLKQYRQDFRNRFCECLLSRRVIVMEGATENSAMPAAARVLSRIDPERYSSFEELGLSSIDAGGESNVKGLGSFYKSLDKQVFALCDKQGDSEKREIELEVDQLYMHQEKGFEDLVIKNTTESALIRFFRSINFPSHLQMKFPDPESQIHEAMSAYFEQKKAEWSIAEFLFQCEESEIPLWIRETCISLKSKCLVISNQPTVEVS